MNAQFLPTIILCAVVILVMFLMFAFCSSILKHLFGIESILAGKYVRFDPKIDDLVDLAVDYWRLGKHLEKVKPSLKPEDVKRIENSLRRMENYLKKNDVEVNDYTGRTANDGMNVEVISVEHDPKLKKPIIKETIVPAVSYKGTLRKKSQVVILDNSKDKEQKDDKNDKN